MESDQGVFISNVATSEWADDPDVPGTDMHELVRRDGVWAGLTRILTTDGPCHGRPGSARRSTSSRAL